MWCLKWGFYADISLVSHLTCARACVINNIEYCRHFWNKQKPNSAETTRAWTSRRSQLQWAWTVSDACCKTGSDQYKCEQGFSSRASSLFQSAPLMSEKLVWCFGISEDKKNSSLCGIRWHAVMGIWLAFGSESVCNVIFITFCLFQYYAESHGVIYVIDSTDEERLSESKNAFGEFCCNEGSMQFCAITFLISGL